MVLYRPHLGKPSQKLLSEQDITSLASTFADRVIHNEQMIFVDKLKDLQQHSINFRGEEI